MSSRSPSRKGSNRRDRRRSRLEELERRVLLSAEMPVAPLLQEPLADSANDAGALVAPAAGNAPLTAVVEISRHELVVVDTTTPDYQQLVDDLLKANDGSRMIDILLLDPARDGFQQMTEALAGRESLSAIHLISHGSAGNVQLGGSTLNSDTLLLHASEIAQWGESLTKDGDLLIYGCDVTSTADGQQFIDALSQLTGADVAASDDKTGSTTLGGDWDLEFTHGVVEAQTLSAGAAAEWTHVLAITAQGGETLVNLGATAGSQATTAYGGGNVAMDATGNYVVVGNDSNTGDVGFQRYNASGVAQGTPTRANTTTANLQSEVQVAMDSSGNFVVVWMSASQDGSGDGIYAQRYNASGVAQGSEFRVNTTTANNQGLPAVAMDASGNFVVTWTDAAADGSSNGIYAQRYNASGVAQGAQFRVNSTTSGSQTYPVIAMNASGSFVIAWEGSQTGDVDIYFQRYDAAGSAVGAETRINSTTSGTQWNAAVAMDDAGNFVVAWEDAQGADGSLGGIYARRFDSTAGALGSEFRVNTTTTDQQTVPAIAMNSSGEFLVAWNSANQDTSGPGVYAQLYTASGTASGSEFRVNTTVTGSQWMPSVAFEGGNAVVVWSGNGTGDTDGTFTQRYLVTNAAPVDLYAVNGLAASSLIGAYGFTAAGNLGRDDAGDNAPITLIGSPTQTAGPSGSGALDLSGGQYGNIAGITTGGAMTFAASVRFDTTGSWQRVFDFGQASSGGIGNIYVGRDGSTSNLTFTIEKFGSYTHRATAAGVITNGTWLHFAATVDASGNMILYVNGVLAASEPGVVPETGVRTNNFIGKSNWAADAAFDGAIDDLVIANGALTATQVATLYQQSNGFSVAENAANGTVVGTVVARDPDAGDTYTFSLSNSAGGRFAIGADGTITVANGSLIDYESATSHSITVLVTDQNGASYSEAFTVNVSNIADTLVVTTGSDNNDSGITTGASYTTEWLNANMGADGRISLREALIAANNTAGVDTINFNIPDALVGGVHTITLSSILPNITDAVVINGASEPDWATGSRPVVVLNGAGIVQDGLRISGAGSGGSTVRGLIIQNFTQDGIDITSSNGNTVVGNWIGLNAAGTGATGNSVGVNIWNSANNIIGGSSAADRNVISGNSALGINLNTDNGTTTGNQIKGNYIGTNAAGTSAVGNVAQGIWVNAAGNTIGGTGANEGNVISGTTNWVGIQLETPASNTTIVGNRIGLNAAGTSAIANTGGGIYILSANNTIGGTTANARNVISGNGGAGITLIGTSATGNVVIGNYVGTNAAGTGDVNGASKTSGVSGIVIDNGASNNRIGTDADGVNDTAERNVVSGNNWYGVEMLGSGTTGNVVQGNYIGTDVTGLVALGNSMGGVSFWNGAANNRVGGGATGAGNVISGNETGVLVANGVSNNKVQGNYIGLGADGSTSVGNTGAGVYFYNGGSAALVTGNVIGTDADGSNDAGERNVISANVNGVVLFNAQVSGNTVAGNYIGTDASGLLDRGNTYDGVRIEGGANANTVGGSLVAQRNLIAGNGQDGIQVGDEASDGNVLRGNWVGVNATATATLRNDGDGIFISGGADNTVVGGTGANEGNWVAGNGVVGVEVDGASTGTVIQGNRIGTDLAGTANWGHQENGVLLQNGASNTQVGGTVAGAANVIAFSGQGGVWTAGIDVADAASTGNVILGNSIYSNVGLGIDLGSDGVTANDAGDADTGANNLQNTAALTRAVVNGTSLTLSGTLSAAANTYYRVEIYSNASADPSGSGEGKTFLNSVNLSLGATGTTNFSISFSDASLAVGQYISVTVTRCNSTYSTFYDTSEFSNAIVTESPDSAPAGQDRTISIAEDATHTFTLADFPFTDADGDSLSRVWIESLPGSGTLLLNGVAVAQFDAITAADINAGLLTYVPASNVNGTAATSFDFTVEDSGSSFGGGATADPAPNTLTINISAINDQPTLSNLGNTVSHTEGGSSVVLAASATVADAELSASNNFNGATLTLARNGGANTTDALSFDGTNVTTSGANVLVGGVQVGTYSFTGGQMVVTFGANATQARVNTLLQNIVYWTTSDTPPSSVQIDWTFSDGNGGAQGSGGTLSGTGSTTVNITAANDPPTVNVVSPRTTNEDVYKRFSTFIGNAITISDPDAGASNLELTISAQHGTVSLGGTAGLTFTVGDGTTDTTMTFRGTLSAINTALDGITYDPTPNYNGPGGLDFSLSDLGNSGSGGAQIATATQVITVLAVNDPPAFTSSAVTAATEDSAYSYSITTSDVDTGDVRTITAPTLPTWLTLTDNGNGTATLTGTPTNAQVGTHSVVLQVSDGTVNVTQSFTITVTNTNDAPTFTSTAVTAATEDSAYSYSITTSDVDVGDVRTITAPTLPAWLTLTDNGNGTATLSGTPTNAQVGTHSVVLQVSDGTVNVTQSFTITVTNTNDAPAFTSTAVTAATEDSAYSYSITTSDVDVGDVRTITAPTLPAWLTLTDNGNGTATLTGTPTNAQVGTHSVVLQVSDGTVSVTQSFTITVTNTNDAPAFTSTAVTAATEDSAYSYSITTSDVDTGDVRTITAPTLPAWLTLTDNGNGTATLTGTPTNAQVGTHSVVLQVSDGTVNVTQSFTITVTNTNDAPAFTSTAVTATTEDSAYSYSITTSDVDVGDVRTITAPTLPAWLTLTDNGNGTATLSGTPTNAQVGTHSVVLQVSDGTVNVTQSFTITVTNTNDAPTFTSTAVTAATEDSAYSYAITTSDVDVGDVRTITAPTLPAWLTLTDNGNGTATLTGTPTNAQVGTHSVVLQVSDGTVNVTQSFTITVANTNDAPAFTSTAVTAATEDSAYSYSITTSDVDVGDVRTITAPTLPAWLTLTDNGNGTATLTGTPTNAQVGTHSVVLQVSDGTVNVTQSFTITVANTNDAPTFTSTAVTAATEDSAYSYAITTSDVDVGDVRTITAPTLPAWLTLTDNGNGTATLTGTPTNAQVGTHSVVLQVSDGTVNVTQSFTITVANSNDQPTVANAIANQSATEDSAFSFQFASNTFADVDVGDSLTYSASGLPAWLSFNAATRTFSGTPANADVGTVTITVRATDGSGAYIEDSFDIVVANSNDQPTVANPIANQSATEDAAFSFQFAANTFADVDVGDSLNYSASGLPAWLSFNAGTRTFSGTPANTDVGTVTITVRATDGSGAYIEDSFDIVVSNTNDAPVLDNTGTMTLSPIARTNLTGNGNTFAQVIASAGGDRITDIDAGAVEGIALTGTTIVGSGHWEYSLDAGSNWSAVGSVADSNALLLRSTDRLRFVPDGTSTGSASLTLRAWDQSAGAAGAKVSTASNGGATAFSTASESATLSVVDSTDMPTAVDDTAQTQTGAAVTINVVGNDVDPQGHALTVLDAGNGANGSVSISGGSVTYTPDAGFSGDDSFQYVVTDGNEGLTHYWRLDGNGTDVVGGANGTLMNGPTTIDGHYGSALQFDGVNDYVDLPDITYGSEFSLAFYFQIGDNSGNQVQYLYSHGAIPNAGLANTVQVGVVEASHATLSQRNNLITTVWDGNDAATGQLLVDISTLIGDGQWHLYTMTVTPGVGTNVYVDGVLRGNIVRGGDPIDPTGHAYIGARSDLDPTRFLNAGNAVDGLSIYSRSLSDGEVSNLWSGAANVGTTSVHVNAPPVVTTSGGAVTFTENGAAVAIDSGVTLSDANDSMLTGATIRISGNYSSGNDLLSFTNQLGITGSWDASTGTLTLSGSSSVANYQTAIRTITFSNASESPSTALRTIGVTVTDGKHSSATATCTVTVVAQNDQPTVANAIANQSATEDTAFSFQFASNTFADVDAGDSLTYSATGLPAWLSFDAATRTFAGTPTNADVGTVTITVRATDGSGAYVEDIFDIVVSNTNDPPTVANAIPNQNATEDTAFSYQFASNTFADVDAGDSRTYSASGLPAWLSFDAATRTFTGTPANADVGTVTVTVRATDGSGAFVEDQFDIVVTNTNDAPTFTSTAVTAATEDSAYSYAITSSDVDVGDSFTITAPTLPAWLSLTDNGDGTATLTGTPTNAEVGTHTVVLALSDGTVTVTQSFTITVANTNDTPTVANAIPNQSATEDAAFSFQFASNTFADADTGDTLTYSAAGLPGWLSFDAATRTFSGTPANADVGTITVTVRATDDSGAFVEDQFDIVVTNTNDAPAFTSTAVTTATEDSAYSYAITSSDVDVGDSFTITAPTLPAWLSLTDNGDGTATLTGTPTNAEVGTHTVVLALSDGTVTVTQSFTITVANTNDAPVFTSTAVTAATEDSAYSYAITSSDVDVGDSFTITAPTLPAWLSLTDNGDGTATLTGTPTNAEVGTHTVVLALSDGTVTVTQSFTITVANTNDAPAFTSTAVTAATEDSAYSYAITSSDVDVGDSFTITAPTLPAWLSLTDNGDGTATLTGTPTNAEVGTHTVVLALSDGTVTVTQSFTITVANTNDAPAFTSTAVTAATEDSAYSYAITTSDVDVGDSFTITAPTLPAWLSLTDNGDGTATLTGTPTNAEVGTHTVVLALSDGTVTVTQSFTITVANTNDAPVFTSTAVTAATEDSAYSYAITSSDVDVGDSFTITAPTLPAWLTLTDNGDGTATLTGTPTNAEVGTHTVVLALSDGTVTVTQSFTITVANTNDAPAFTSTAVTAATEDSAYSYAITSSDVDVGDSFTITAPTLPAWLNLTDNGDGTATLTGTPTNAEVGTHTVVLALSDGTVTVTQSFTITVANTNDAPIVSNAIADQQSISDSSFSFQFAPGSFVDVDAGDTITYTTSALPSWLSFDAATRTFTGAPTFADTGTFSITVTATDAAGLSASDTFTLTIVNNNVAPTLARNLVFSVGPGAIRTVDSNVLLAADPDTAASQVIYTLMSVPGHGELRLAGAALGNGDVFSQGDIDAGRLTYVHDGSSDASDSFLFNVSDPRGGTIGTSRFAIRIESPTSPPIGDNGGGVGGGGSAGGDTGDRPVDSVDSPSSSNSDNSSDDRQDRNNPPAAPPGTETPLIDNEGDLYAEEDGSDHDLGLTDTGASGGDRNEHRSGSSGMLQGNRRTKSDASAFGPQTNTIEGTAIGSGLNLALDSLQQQLQEGLRGAGSGMNPVTIATTTASVAASAGYLTWLLRGGTLFASVLASLPTWRTLDPLPVLSRSDKEARKLPVGTRSGSAGSEDDGTDPDDKEIELFDGRGTT